MIGFCARRSMGRATHFACVCGLPLLGQMLLPERSRERRCVVRERELVPRELVGGEPAQLGEIVGGTRVTAGAGDPGQAQDNPTVVRLVPDAEEVERLDLEARLLPNLTPHPVERLLPFVE